ncbi:MAG: type III-A CRISPR-associated protein Csm2 [Clostridiales bacterium]|nr:type III-A CRISPR-associated protein Csm2 [Clostridiales bacterium]
MILNEKNYVDKAQSAICALNKEVNQRTGRSFPKITTSKIRNLLAMVSDIYNEVISLRGESLDEELCGRIEYLKVRFYYEAGRDNTVRRFMEKTELLKCLDEIKGSKKRYLLFCRYMEALVAYHRYYGGE